MNRRGTPETGARIYIHPTAMSPYRLAILEALTQRRAAPSASGRAVRLVPEPRPRYQVPEHLQGPVRGGGKEPRRRGN